MSAVEPSDVTAVEMSVADEARLTELENLVAAGLDTFVAVGNALAEINNARLYRCTHASFEAYLADRWGMYVQRPRLPAGGRGETVDNCRQCEPAVVDVRGAGASLARPRRRPGHPGVCQRDRRDA